MLTTFFSVCLVPLNIPSVAANALLLLSTSVRPPFVVFQ
jgi:hypothetical protein